MARQFSSACGIGALLVHMQFIYIITRNGQPLQFHEKYRKVINVNGD